MKVIKTVVSADLLWVEVPQLAASDRSDTVELQTREKAQAACAHKDRNMVLCIGCLAAPHITHSCGHL